MPVWSNFFPKFVMPPSVFSNQFANSHKIIIILCKKTAYLISTYHWQWGLKCRKYNSNWIKAQLRYFKFLIIENFINRSFQSYSWEIHIFYSLNNYKQNSAYKDLCPLPYLQSIGYYPPYSSMKWSTQTGWPLS